MTTTINFNATGSRRKELVATISEITGESKKYLGAPSFAYQVGNYTINREGNVEIDTEPWNLEILNLIEKLAERGFISSPIADWPERESTDETENATAAPQAADVATEEAAAENPSTEENEADTGEENANSAETTETSDDFQTDSENGGFTVSMPEESLGKRGWENLGWLMAAKYKLIMKALGCDTPTIEKKNGIVSFPWFRSYQPSAEVMNATALLISALVKMAKTQKRITAKEKEVENEKYAFRCFLLRLGFIGAEYRDVRRTLLQNFSGSSAFKAGQKNVWYKATMVVPFTDGDAENGMCAPESYEDMVRAANEADAMDKANAKAGRIYGNAADCPVCTQAEPVSDEEYAAWKAEQDAA